MGDALFFRKIYIEMGRDMKEDKRKEVEKEIKRVFEARVKMSDYCEEDHPTI